MADRSPIPTFYGGIRFRSRLEARWALMFDALRDHCQESFAWRYEPETFGLGPHQRILYKPDFFIAFEPGGAGTSVWLEVKPANWPETLIRAKNVRERCHVDLQKYRDFLPVAQDNDCEFWIMTGAPGEIELAAWSPSGAIRDNWAEAWEVLRVPEDVFDSLQVSVRATDFSDQTADWSGSDDWKVDLVNYLLGKGLDPDAPWDAIADALGLKS